MIDKSKIIALRMERQFLTRRADEGEYDSLYRDTQPGQNVYWNGFGDPPSLSWRADFDDMEFNRRRQSARELIKGRFSGGNLGWIERGDMELFACAFRKPIAKFTERQGALLDLIRREGPMNIGLMKELTGMLVKEITPALHRLQEAFLIYEDQHDGEWDRGWYKFSEMFPDVDLEKYSRAEALKILLGRFAYRMVVFTAENAKLFYKLPAKEINGAIRELVCEGVLAECEFGYALKSDFELLGGYCGEVPKSVFAMHRNDILVKAEEHALKARYPHSYPDTLYYLLIDGEFRGAVVGKFRYTPEVEDVITDLSREDAEALKAEILRAVHLLCGEKNPIRRYCGETI